MILFPQAQRKAHEELATVVGPQRLPTYEDELALPYVRALIRELLRWRSVAPLGVPHRALDEDEYKGWRIPKGSIVIANIW